MCAVPLSFLCVKTYIHSVKVHGIHHVTAITANIKENLHFYTEVLGLRLVKKSVNQDDVRAYHLFYADAVATPGTDLTFFDWPNAGANRPGPGTVALTTYRIRRAALPFWEARLRESGVSVETAGDVLNFVDPEGQALQLVADDELPGEVEPWTKAVRAEESLRGILSVNISSVRFDLTRMVLTDLLGFADMGGGLFEVRDTDSIGRVHLTASDSRQLGHPGAGGVHHVAFRVKDDAALLAFKEKIEKAGISTSGYVDRFYFHSLYFREPGGVLFELATDGPGMHADEDLDSLGEKLALPPFLEHRRGEIEAGLLPL